MKQKVKIDEPKETLRKWFIKYTNCEIQESKSGDWPCGTCTIALLKGLGLDPTKKEYQERNKPIDRINEVWRAILQIRDAKSNVKTK